MFANNRSLSKGLNIAVASGSGPLKKTAATMPKVSGANALKPQIKALLGFESYNGVSRRFRSLDIKR